MTARLAGLTGVLALLFAGSAAGAEVRIHEGTNLAADVNPIDGRIVIGLLDGLWQLPARGGDAQRMTPLTVSATRPRWSPDGLRVLFTRDGNRLAIMSSDGRSIRPVTPAGATEQMGDWHPSGERVVFSAPGDGSGLDLYERDLATGLRWRLTDHPGDETDAAWSADGRHFSYVRQDAGHWYLMVKPFGQPARVVQASAEPIYLPSWRPDGTLLTYLAADAMGQLELRMTILSEPPLTRSLVRHQDLFLSPVIWIDRQRLLYTADGVIKTRGFEDRQSRILSFSAAIGTPPARGRARERKRLPDADRPGGELIVRASRLFDGLADGYRRNVDIHLRDGRIVAVRPAGNAAGLPVIDIGNVTVLPGLIDIYAGLPASPTPATATAMLAAGVTTVVTPQALDPATAWPDVAAPRLLRAVPPDHAAADISRIGLVNMAGAIRTTGEQRDSLARWRRRGVPLLAANWRSGLAAGADLTLGSAELPTSPQGKRYEDLETLLQGGPLTLVSALADATTPGLSSLWNTAATVPRRYARPPLLANGRTRIVVGSQPSGLPPGIATQAELHALHAAGLTPAAALQAGTSGAAAALGLTGQLGAVVPGARADLVLVAGDPLQRFEDVSAVVAVVIDGQFFSIAGLRDALATVE